MNTVDVLSKISVNDLKAAKILYKNKLYPQAVFFLQQSIEKMFKSFGALQDNLTIQELKSDVGHNSTRVLSCLMQKFLNKISLQERNVHCNDIDINEQVELREFLNDISKASSLFSNSKLLEKVPKEEFMKLLPDLMTRKRRLKFLAEIYPEFEKESKLVLKAICDKSTSDIAQEHLDKMLAEIQSVLADMFDVEYLLIVLSFFVPASCVENTRYPSQKGIPSQIYTYKHPIVKSFPKLIKLCRATQRGLNRIYHKIDDLE